MERGDEILKMISQGEGPAVEFKSSFNSEVIETLVAFANGQGGKVVIGINPSGIASGVMLHAETLQQWINEVKSKTQPSLLPEYESYNVAGKTIVILSVAEYPVKPVSTRGRFFKRAGNSNHLMRADEVSDMHMRTMNYSWDSYVTHPYSMEDISHEKVNRFIKLANKDRVNPITDDPVTVLRKLNLIIDERPTNACMLLFRKEEHFQSTVMAGRFSDPVTIKDSINFRSDLFSLVDSIMEFIRKHINKEFIVTGDPRHEERWQYPLNAVREIVINMIIHRNYQDVNDSYIKIYNNRIEFFNPGQLLSPLTVERLVTGDYSSVIRNANIAAIFKEAGIIEKYGSGVQRILISCRQYGLKDPVFENFQHGFRVTVFSDKQDDLTDGNEHLTDNAGGQTGGQTGGQADGQTGGQTGLHRHLTPVQKELLDMMIHNPRISRKELANRLEKNESAVQKIIEQLKKKEVIRRAGGDYGGFWEVIRNPQG